MEQPREFPSREVTPTPSRHVILTHVEGAHAAETKRHEQLTPDPGGAEMQCRLHLSLSRPAGCRHDARQDAVPLPTPRLAQPAAAALSSISAQFTANKQGLFGFGDLLRGQEHVSGQHEATALSFYIEKSTVDFRTERSFTFLVFITARPAYLDAVRM